jgi:excisionase family DNA binding protein
MAHPKSKNVGDNDALLLSIAATQRTLGGLHRETIGRLIRKGHLTRVKIGSRSLITRASVDAFVQHLPEHRVVLNTKRAEPQPENV